MRMMRMDSNESTLLTIVVVGITIAIGKLLNGGEHITVRLLLGRVILGGGLSASAGALLAICPSMHPVALVGIASAFGILGQSFLEMLVQRYFLRDKDEPDNH
jgi:hypothetical protein